MVEENNQEQDRNSILITDKATLFAMLPKKKSKANNNNEDIFEENIQTIQNL